MKRLLGHSQIDAEKKFFAGGVGQPSSGGFDPESAIFFDGSVAVAGLDQKRLEADARGELIIFITPHIVNRAEALGR